MNRCKNYAFQKHYKNYNNKELIDNNKNNNINNILKENIKERIPIQSRTVKEETESRSWIDNLFLDPKDFEDNDTSDEGWY